MTSHTLFRELNTKYAIKVRSDNFQKLEVKILLNITTEPFKCP